MKEECDKQEQQLLTATAKYEELVMDNNLMSGYKTVGMTVEHSRHVFVPAHLMTSLVYMEKEYTMGGL
jgi:hypothetical protein